MSKDYKDRFYNKGEYVEPEKEPLGAIAEAARREHQRQIDIAKEAEKTKKAATRLAKKAEQEAKQLAKKAEQALLEGKNKEGAQVRQEHRNKKADCRETYHNDEFKGQFKTQELFNEEFVYNPNGIFTEKHYNECPARILRIVYWKLKDPKKTNTSSSGPLMIPDLYPGKMVNGKFRDGIKQLQEKYRLQKPKQLQEPKPVTEDKKKEVEPEKNTVKEKDIIKEISIRLSKTEEKKDDIDDYIDDDIDDNIDKNIKLSETNINKIPIDMPIGENDLTNLINTDPNKYLRELEKKSYKYNEENPDELEFLYPDLDDPNFSLKIAKKLQFNEHKIDLDINKEYSVEEQSNLLCKADFDLMPHQNFIKNFMSHETPYNGILLFHGVGTGKTCSAIGIAEEYRLHLKQYNNLNRKEIIIVANPNVQDNFKKQLFDESKLEETNNGIFKLNTCIGNSLINEINPDQNIKLTREQLSKQILKLRDSSYVFMGYQKFGKYIEKRINVDELQNNENDMKELKKAKIRSNFNNRLIIIDEVHNIRTGDDNPKQKLLTKYLKEIAKYAVNLKLVFLSATPMYNNYNEIISLTNILNINDKRSIITESEIFDEEGNFIKTDDYSGEELLKRKLTGYVSYVRGENPYAFPFRIYPEDFSKMNMLTKKDIPDKQFNNINIDYELKLPLYMVTLPNEQTIGYSLLLKYLKLSNNNTNWNELTTLGYNQLNKPLESLNFVFPKLEIDMFLRSGIDIDDLSKEQLENIIMSFDSDSGKNTIDIIGKSGLKRIMDFKKDKVMHSYNYKPEILSNYGRIFSLNNLEKYSVKLHSICKNIMKSEGISIIYAAHIEGGAVPIALALEELGFTRFSTSPYTKSLFENPPTEQIDSIYMEPKSDSRFKSATPIFKPAKYAMITGDSLFSQKNAEDLSFITKADNKDGSKVKVIIISKAASEGLDFANIRQVHILEPWYNLNRIEQIIGRGVRNLSHCSLPFEERNVEIYMYAMRPFLNNDQKIEVLDMYLYRLAENKAKKIGNVTRLMKNISIDCNLNIAQTNLSMDKFKELSDNSIVEIKLASNKTIKYRIGDRPFSSICDYKDNCNYECSNNEIITDTISSTYGDVFARSNYNSIIKRIKEIFKDTPFIKINELIKRINYNKKYPEQQIYYILTLFINNMETLDNYNRKGNIINRGDYYIFKPIEVSDSYANTYERTNHIDYKHSKLIIEYPTGKIYNVEDDKQTKETEIKKIENPVFENKNKYNKIMDDFENKLYNCIEGKKEKIGKNSDWYEEMESIDVKKFLREKHNIDDELMKKYIIYHFLDTQNIDTKITLLKVIYEAENMKINVGGEGGEEEEFTHDQEEAIEKNVMINMAAEDERMKEKNKNLLLIEKHMKNYFDKKELRLDALNFCYSFYNIEKNINDFYVYRDNEFQLLNSAVDNLKYQQLELKNAIDKKSMHNVVGFMSPFKNEGNVFKVKDIYSQYNNKGSYCKNLSKEDTIKKLNCLLNSFKCQFKVDDHEDEKDKPDFKSSYTPDEIKDKMRKTGLAIIAEFLFRYYDEKRERGLRYFFDAEESHISQISMLRPI